MYHITMVERRYHFLRSGPDLCPVLKGNTHIILAIHRHEIHEAVPERRLEFGDGVQPSELVKEGFDCRLSRLFVAYRSRDRVQLRFDFVEPSGQPVVALLVIVWS